MAPPVLTRPAIRPTSRSLPAYGPHHDPLLFYKNVVALDRNQHAALKLKPADSLDFAGNATSLPIVVGEFAEVARQSPIAFLRVENGDLVPVALVGLPGGRNLYVNDDGKWTAPYIPAFVRTAPSCSPVR
jgi:hypothetical protein